MDIIDDDKASELPRPRAAGTMDPVVETEKHELTSIWMQNGKTENQTFGLGRSQLANSAPSQFEFWRQIQNCYRPGPMQNETNLALYKGTLRQDLYIKLK